MTDPSEPSNLLRPWSGAMEVLNKPGHFINTLRRFPQDEWDEGRGGGGWLDVLGLGGC